MDRPKLSAAFQKAIAVSKLAEAIPSASTPGAEVAISSWEHNVQIEATKLAELVSVLRELPPFSADVAFGLCDGIGGCQIDFDEVARAILAQGLRTGDIDRAVSELVDTVEKNEGVALLIMPLSGVGVGKELDLGASVSLLPLQDIPPSYARAVVQGQAKFPISFRVPASRAALVTTMIVKPLLFKFDQEGQRALVEQTKKTQVKFDHLTDACNCLALASTTGAPSTSIVWSQLIWPASSFGSGMFSYWNASSSSNPIAGSDLDQEKAQKICQAFFALPQEFRDSVLRIPLDRLNRAATPGGRWVDQAIDLGIALEALLLHDLEASTELSYRLKLRGAHLLGTDQASRRLVFNLLGELYKLRSKAVHRGHIDERQKTAETLRSGVQCCAEMLRTVIERGQLPEDWDFSVLGN